MEDTNVINVPQNTAVNASKELVGKRIINSDLSYVNGRLIEMTVLTPSSSVKSDK